MVNILPPKQFFSTLALRNKCKKVNYSIVKRVKITVCAVKIKVAQRVIALKIIDVVVKGTRV